MMKFTRTIDAIDAHTAGEPIRVITSGIPRIKGATMLEKMRYFSEHYDFIRKMVINEPRGHKDMFASAIIPPTTDDADLGILFMNNEGMSVMCGHGTIGTVKAAAQTGLLNLHDGINIVKLDVPAGRVTAEVLVENDDVKHVAFINVPAFVYKENVKIPLPDIGEVNTVITYGGSFYIVAEQEQFGLTVSPENTSKLVHYAMQMKNWVNQNMEICHPEHPEINGIYGALITAPVDRTEQGVRSRHICVFAEGSVDRSPCGTGTSSRLSLLAARGQIKIGEVYESASIINTKFTATPIAHTKVCGYNAVIPKVAGSAWITGFNKFVLAPDDPVPEGFILQ